MRYKVFAYTHGCDTYEVEAETAKDAIELIVNDRSIPRIRHLVYFDEETWETEVIS